MKQSTGARSAGASDPACQISAELRRIGVVWRLVGVVWRLVGVVWRPVATTPRRRATLERGMVTVELVFGLLIVSIMMAVFGWAIMLFGVQVGCIDTAKDVARQAARGDQQAVRTEESRAPRGAKIEISGGGSEITVTVEVRSQPFDFVPAITLTARATALREPGELK